MAVNGKELKRVEYMEMVRKMLEENGEDVLEIATNAFAFPIVDKDGNDLFIRIKVEIPKGAKDEPFDGYALRDDFAMKRAEKAEKAKRQAEEKAKKIAKDKKQRELSAKIKAEKAKAKSE